MPIRLRKGVCLDEQRGLTLLITSHSTALHRYTLLLPSQLHTKHTAPYRHSTSICSVLVLDQDPSQYHFRASFFHLSMSLSLFSLLVLSARCLLAYTQMQHATCNNATMRQDPSRIHRMILTISTYTCHAWVLTCGPTPDVQLFSDHPKPHHMPLIHRPTLTQMQVLKLLNAEC